MNKHLAILLCFALLTTGCATIDPGAVRDLTVKEKQAFAALDKRLTENRSTMAKAAKNLGELGAEWTEKEFELELKLAKAKRLESMQAPWAPTRDELAKTQRTVVLYHLYEVEMAEQKVLDARMAQRRAAAQEVLKAYDRFAQLLGDASSNLETVLQDLNQPKSARLRAFTSSFLGEVTAFREQLQQSDNPRLRALAEDVARTETAVATYKQQADQALQGYFSLTGRGK